MLDQSEVCPSVYYPMVPQSDLDIYYDRICSSGYPIQDRHRKLYPEYWFWFFYLQIERIKKRKSFFAFLFEESSDFFPDSLKFFHFSLILAANHGDRLVDFC